MKYYPIGSNTSMFLPLEKSLAVTRQKSDSDPDESEQSSSNSGSRSTDTRKKPGPSGSSPSGTRRSQQSGTASGNLVERVVSRKFGESLLLPSQSVSPGHRRPSREGAAGCQATGGQSTSSGGQNRRPSREHRGSFSSRGGLLEQSAFGNFSPGSGSNRRGSGAFGGDGDGSSSGRVNALKNLVGGGDGSSSGRVSGNLKNTKNTPPQKNQMKKDSSSSSSRNAPKNSSSSPLKGPATSGNIMGSIMDEVKDDSPSSSSSASSGALKKNLQAHRASLTSGSMGGHFRPNLQSDKTGSLAGLRRSSVASPAAAAAAVAANTSAGAERNNIPSGTNAAASVALGTGLRSFAPRLSLQGGLGNTNSMGLGSLGLGNPLGNSQALGSQALQPRSPSKSALMTGKRSSFLKKRVSLQGVQSIGIGGRLGRRTSLNYGAGGEASLGVKSFKAYRASVRAKEAAERALRDQRPDALARGSDDFTLSKILAKQQEKSILLGRETDDLGDEAEGRLSLLQLVRFVKRASDLSEELALRLAGRKKEGEAGENLSIQESLGVDGKMDSATKETSTTTKETTQSGRASDRRQTVGGGLLGTFASEGLASSPGTSPASSSARRGDLSSSRDPSTSPSRGHGADNKQVPDDVRVPSLEAQSLPNRAKLAIAAVTLRAVFEKQRERGGSKRFQKERLTFLEAKELLFTGEVFELLATPAAEDLEGIPLDAFRQKLERMLLLVWEPAVQRARAKRDLRTAATSALAKIGSQAAAKAAAAAVAGEEDGGKEEEEEEDNFPAEMLAGESVAPAAAAAVLKSAQLSLGEYEALGLDVEAAVIAAAKKAEREELRRQAEAAIEREEQDPNFFRVNIDPHRRMPVADRPPLFKLPARVLEEKVRLNLDGRGGSSGSPGDASSEAALEGGAASSGAAAGIASNLSRAARAGQIALGLGPRGPVAVSAIGGNTTSTANLNIPGALNSAAQPIRDLDDFRFVPKRVDDRFVFSDDAAALAGHGFGNEFQPGFKLGNFSSWRFFLPGLVMPEGADAPFHAGGHPLGAVGTTGANSISLAAAVSGGGGGASSSAVSGGGANLGSATYPNLPAGMSGLLGAGGSELLAAQGRAISENNSNTSQHHLPPGVERSGKNYTSAMDHSWNRFPERHEVHMGVLRGLIEADYPLLKGFLHADFPVHTKFTPLELARCRKRGQLLRQLAGNSFGAAPGEAAGNNFGGAAGAASSSSSAEQGRNAAAGETSGENMNSGGQQLGAAAEKLTPASPSSPSSGSVEKKGAQKSSKASKRALKNGEGRGAQKVGFATAENNTAESSNMRSTSALRRAAAGNNYSPTSAGEEVDEKKTNVDELLVFRPDPDLPLTRFLATYDFVANFGGRLAAPQNPFRSSELRTALLGGAPSGCSAAHRGGRGGDQQRGDQREVPAGAAESESGSGTTSALGTTGGGININAANNMDAENNKLARASSWALGRLGGPGGRVKDVAWRDLLDRVALFSVANSATAQFQGFRAAKRMSAEGDAVAQAIVGGSASLGGGSLAASLKSSKRNSRESKAAAALVSSTPLGKALRAAAAWEGAGGFLSVSFAHAALVPFFRDLLLPAEKGKTSFSAAAVAGRLAVGDLEDLRVDLSAARRRQGGRGGGTSGGGGGNGTSSGRNDGGTQSSSLGGAVVGGVASSGILGAEEGKRESSTSKQRILQVLLVERDFGPLRYGDVVVEVSKGLASLQAPSAGEIIIGEKSSSGGSSPKTASGKNSPSSGKNSPSSSAASSPRSGAGEKSPKAARSSEKSSSGLLQPGAFESVEQALAALSKNFTSGKASGNTSTGKASDRSSGGGASSSSQKLGRVTAGGSSSSSQHRSRGAALVTQDLLVRLLGKLIEGGGECWVYRPEASSALVPPRSTRAAVLATTSPTSGAPSGGSGGLDSAALAVAAEDVAAEGGLGGGSGGCGAKEVSAEKKDAAPKKDAAATSEDAKQEVRISEEVADAPAQKNAADGGGMQQSAERKGKLQGAVKTPPPAQVPDDVELLALTEANLKLLNAKKEETTDQPDLAAKAMASRGLGKQVRTKWPVGKAPPSSSAHVWQLFRAAYENFQGMVYPTNVFGEDYSGVLLLRKHGATTRFALADSRAGGFSGSSSSGQNIVKGQQVGGIQSGKNYPQENTSSQNGALVENVPQTLEEYLRLNPELILIPDFFSPMPGDTALHIAVRLQHTHVAQLLLLFKARPDFPLNCAEESALDLARKSRLPHLIHLMEHFAGVFAERDCETLLAAQRAALVLNELPAEVWAEVQERDRIFELSGLEKDAAGGTSTTNTNLLGDTTINSENNLIAGGVTASAGTSETGSSAASSAGKLRKNFQGLTAGAARALEARGGLGGIHSLGHHQSSHQGSTSSSAATQGRGTGYHTHHTGIVPGGAGIETGVTSNIPNRSSDSSHPGLPLKQRKDAKVLSGAALQQQHSALFAAHERARVAAASNAASSANSSSSASSASGSSAGILKVALPALTDGEKRQVVDAHHVRLMLGLGAKRVASAMGPVAKRQAMRLREDAETDLKAAYGSAAAFESAGGSGFFGLGGEAASALSSGQQNLLTSRSGQSIISGGAVAVGGAAGTSTTGVITTGTTTGTTSTIVAQSEIDNVHARVARSHVEYQRLCGAQAVRRVAVRTRGAASLLAPTFENFWGAEESLGGRTGLLAAHVSKLFAPKPDPKAAVAAASSGGALYKFLSSGFRFLGTGLRNQS